LKGEPLKSLEKQRFLVVGAGSAGLGVASAIAHSMTTELGTPPDQAYNQCVIQCSLYWHLDFIWWTTKDWWVEARRISCLLNDLSNAVTWTLACHCWRLFEWYVDEECMISC
jgi:hypothetical protein